MFKIRQEPADVFRRQALDDFERRTIRHLREHLAEQTQAFSDQELRERIRNSIPRAAKYEFTTQKQIVSYVDATYLLGDGFESDDRHEDIVDLMRRTKEFSADQRAGLMVGMAYGRYHRDLLEGRP